MRFHSHFVTFFAYQITHLHDYALFLFENNFYYSTNSQFLFEHSPLRNQKMLHGAQLVHTTDAALGHKWSATWQKILTSRLDQIQQTMHTVFIKSLQPLTHTRWLLLQI